MPDKFRTRERYGEAFWRKHHEAWQQSALNQREYCEAQGIPLKAFGNWRAKFKAEPQLPTPKLLYRRRGLSHTLSHRLSHSFSHMTNDLPGPIVPPAREGHRRTFSESDRPNGPHCACACRKSNPNILVVQPAQDRAAKNGPGQFDGARDRRILLQR